MATRIPVEVSQADIDQAMRNNSSRCVVATAIARAVPRATQILVDFHSIRFTDGTRRYTYLTPPKVAEYVVAFDAGDTLHPFSFQLRGEQRLVQRRRVRTPEAKRATHAKRQVARRQATVDKVAADPAKSQAHLDVAADALADALAEHAAVLADHEASGAAGNPIQRPADVIGDDVTPADIAPVARKRQTITRGRARTYGHRQMRINQLDDAPGDFRGPLDTE